MAKLGKNDLEKIMKSLSKRRPVFHREADFQHELAFELREHFKDASIRLEYPQKPIKEKPIEEKGEKRKYIDIVVLFKDEKIGIEVKYLLKGMNKNKLAQPIYDDHDCTKKPEPFYVSGQGGQNKRGYAFVEDIHKLENAVCSYGYLIILTNDAIYSKKARNKNAKCAKYRFHEEAVLEGTFNYGSQAITLVREYKDFKWEEYNAKDSKFEDFKYLIVPIGKK
ncbi:MAG TPA: hypothetical protein PKH33_06780 [bacterium]|nr:hypothetical protein [bacterium]